MILRPFLPPNVPVLRRDDQTLQIGIDDSAVLLMEATTKWSAFLRQLDGRRHRDELARMAKRQGLDPELASALIDDLALRGLVVEASLRRAPFRPAPPSVCVIGDGLAAQLGELFAAEGLGPIGAESVAQIMAAHPDLVVVVSAAVAIDRMLAAELSCADLPHLLVHASASGAVVGPLVIPGVTPCLSCMDLHRADADPGWVRTVPALQTWTVPWSPAMSAWALGTAVAEVRRFLSGAPPHPPVALELSRHDYVVRLRRWSPHPECSCRRP